MHWLGMKNYLFRVPGLWFAWQKLVCPAEVWIVPTEFSDYINVLSLSKPLDFLDSFRISSYGTDRIVNLKSRQASVVYSTVTIPATVYFESGIQYISFAILITGERARLQGNNSHIDYHGRGANFNCLFQSGRIIYTKLKKINKALD